MPILLLSEFSATNDNIFFIFLGEKKQSKLERTIIAQCAEKITLSITGQAHLGELSKALENQGYNIVRH